jgi:large subunit ribosomal protein L17
MRHAMRHRKLGRTSSHREALFRNQLQSLVEKEKIVTTLPKAKELRPIAEKVITRGKHGTLHDRRWVLRWVLKRDLVKKVFDEIAPRFTARPGGYLRIVKLGPRQGDGAEMAVLELVDRPEAEAAEPVKESQAPKAKAPKTPKPKKEAKGSAKEGGKAEAKPKRGEGKEARGETKKVSTQKSGRKQTSAPKKIGS